MQHDPVLNKLTFEWRGRERGSAAKIHNHVLNKLNLIFNTTTKVEWGREKVCRQNICCYVFEFENLFNLI